MEDETGRIDNRLDKTGVAGKLGQTKAGLGLIPVELEFGTMIVDPLSHLGVHLVRDGRYEPELTDYIKSTLKTGQVFFDVGANEGFFSVLAGSLVGPTGRIVSVEPQQRLHERLKACFEANGLHNAELKDVAIGNEFGTARIYLTPDTNSGASGFSQITRYACETQEVELIPLKELVKRSGVEAIDLMKMDIEGFEYEAVLGSPELFEQRLIKRLAVEIHPHLIRGRGLDEAVLIDFLLRCGYRRTSAGPTDFFEIDDA